MLLEVIGKIYVIKWVKSNVMLREVIDFERILIYKQGNLIINYRIEKILSVRKEFKVK